MPDSEDMAPERKRRRRRWVKASAILALAVGAYWWAHRLPSYLVLPSGHGHVSVTVRLGSTGILPHLRYYVQTTVPKGWEKTLDELAGALKAANPPPQFVGTGSPREAYEIESNGFRVLNMTDWPRKCAALDLDAQMTCQNVARLSARPFNSGQGEAVPASYVTFSVSGPYRKEYQHHFITYRLVPDRKNETLVEVWDIRWYNH